jgi:hypothetical protein
VTEVLKSGRDNRITVDDIKTWDIISGYPDPREADQPGWQNDLDLYVEER